MKTIHVSDENYEFLMNLSRELNEQDNRGTRTPYFFQVQIRHQIAAPDGNGITAWFNDGHLVETYEEIKELIEEQMIEMELSKQYSSMSDSDKEYFLESIGYKKVYYDYEFRYENAFLTSKACDAHIEANRHNLSSPVNYLSYASRNPELEKLMEILCGLTGETLHQ